MLFLQVACHPRCQNLAVLTPSPAAGEGVTPNRRAGNSLPPAHPQKKLAHGKNEQKQSCILRKKKEGSNPGLLGANFKAG